MLTHRRPAVPAPAVAASPARREETGSRNQGDAPNPYEGPIISIDEYSGADDFVSISRHRPSDKANKVLGISSSTVTYRRSMEPIPGSARSSIMTTRSLNLKEQHPPQPSGPALPLTSLYIVSGLPKSPQTWTLADPDSVLGLNHTEGAVSRWWRPEVLGSTVSPGAGAPSKKRRTKHEDMFKGTGVLSKQEVGKMLSKALKLSFTREVEIIASTLQPASTIHTFTFSLPAPNTPLAPSPSGDLLRASLLSTSEHRFSQGSFAYPYADDPFAKPSSAFLGPPNVQEAPNPNATSNSTVTYHGVCLTVWSHADAERSTAIRRTLEAGRSRKESAQSLVASRIKSLRSEGNDPTVQARKHAKKSARGPWADLDTDAETEADGVSESDFEVASTIHGPGESTLFLPGDTVFWLPYALTLVSRHPVYDLMRDYLTLSWARFSKDVQSHTLQISKILAYPAPKPGDLIRLDASTKNDTTGDSNLEVVARFPGGLDFGRGLVDINFTMWPLFKCLNVDNILTICEIALSPTGRVLFYSRHPAMLGIAVSTIKYLVELRGWNGIALPAIHSRDAKIYIDDPGPWILGLVTEARNSVRVSSEVCVCDLDINYLSCPSPPAGSVSTKQQRERYRQRILSAFDSHYHPDHSVPSEFKEAFPAGRFRPLCKIQAKRGASAAVAEQIKAPDWWNSTAIIQAFDAVLQDRYKKPSFLRRISMFGGVKRPPRLSAAELSIQSSIRQRATAFVDARDDLETKIGRLSRRLNFLMTESDLWRDKFITFEQYAEKLSGEAHQLRAKINKEQKESRRLSGLYTLTAAEKNKLQAELKETEKAHKDALTELEKMRETMKVMEEERLQMVAEIEAQIESALASMTVGIADSDYGGSRPGSRMSSASGTRSRRTSDANKTMRMRSFATESTLAESDFRENDTIDENEEETQSAPQYNPKRFSASHVDGAQDGMKAVDEGIAEKSENIAQKVLEIQQKLENALTAEPNGKPKRAKVEDDDDDTSEATGVGHDSHSHKKHPKPRHRSGTTSSSQTTSTIIRAEDESKRKLGPEKAELTATPPKRGRRQPSKRNVGSTLSSPPLARANSIATATGTEGSDTDFQSAYSASPRESYGEIEDNDG